MKTISEVFTKEYLAYLNRLSLPWKQKVHNQTMNGQRKSGAKGQSMEFSDFRPYMPGDDLRRVDKRSFARQEQLYTKVYLEEKQAMVHLLLDASASMEGEKFWTASVLAASVAYVAMKRNDWVKLFVFSDGVTKVFQSGQGQTNFPSLLQFLEQISCGGKTDLLRAAVQSIPRPKEGICYVFSDGFSQDDPAKALQRLSHARQKLHLVQVLTPEEAAPKMLGDFRLTDRETEAFLDLSIDAVLLESYSQALRQFQGALRQSCEKSGGRFVSMTTQKEYRAWMQAIIG